MKSQDRRYPIGNFEYGKTWTLDDTRKHIKTIAKFPKDLKKALKKLKNSQLDTPYRRGGWTVRQVVHHIADSHMNAYIRMKLAVTEQTPIIKPYEEANWAETDDGRTAPVKLSLKILTPLHSRWVMFLESLSEEELERGYFHPEQKRVISLLEAIALYAWHSRHHVAHIRLVADGKAQEEEAEMAPRVVHRRRNQQAPTTPPPGAATTERKKPGPKPKAKIAQAAPVGKRTRRSSAEVAAEKAAKAAAPKRSRAEILAQARAVRDANLAKKAPAAAPKKSDGAPKRRRRSSAEVAAEKAAQAAGPKLSKAEALTRARAARAAKLAKQAPAAAPKKSDGAPKRRRRSSAEVAAEKAAQAAGPKLSKAEALTRARAARAAKLAKQVPAAAPKKSADAPKRGRRPSAEVAAAKAAKAAGPKLTRAEILAKARAVRDANLAKKGPKAPKKTADAPKRRRRSSAEVAAEKAAKAAKASGAPKRRGMTPERMAEIRAMRGKKK